MSGEIAHVHTHTHAKRKTDITCVLLLCVYEKDTEKGDKDKKADISRDNNKDRNSQTLRSRQRDTNHKC